MPGAQNMLTVTSWVERGPFNSMSRPRVYISRRIPAAAVAMIAAHCDYRYWDSDSVPVPREVLVRELGQADAAIVMISDRIDEPLLVAAPTCRLIANMAVGYDNIDVSACTARGVLVTNTPDVLTETTADLAFALLLAAARRVVEGHLLIMADQWTAWDPMFMTGVDVFGATLGIVGAGRIGRAIARRAAGFNMSIIYNNRQRNLILERDTGIEYRPLDSLLAESDFVMISVPLSPDTRGLIGRRELGLMKPTAVLVNIARGSVVDETALVAALQEQRIFAAGLDVFTEEPIRATHPLLKLSNCVCAPHIGSATVATRTRMAILAARNVVAGLTDQNPLTPVNSEAWTRQ